jgi:hypothetical protein
LGIVILSVYHAPRLAWILSARGEGRIAEEPKIAHQPPGEVFAWPKGWQLTALDEAILAVSAAPPACSTVGPRLTGGGRRTSVSQRRMALEGGRHAADGSAGSGIPVGAWLQMDLPEQPGVVGFTPTSKPIARQP